MSNKKCEIHRIEGWRKAPTDAGGLMGCSLVVATLNRSMELRRLLNALSSISEVPAQVVIVDGSAGDEVERVVKTWASGNQVSFELIYVRSPAGLTRQRNVGIDATSSAYVFFLDDDCVPLPGYFRQIHDVFLRDDRQEIGGVAGCILNEIEKPLTLRWRLRFALRLLPLGEPSHYLPTATAVPRALQRRFTGTRSVDVLPGCSMAFRRAVLEQCRFSDYFQGYSQGEDTEFSRRVAKTWQLIECGDAHVNHEQATQGRPAGFARGLMATRNRFFIWRRHSWPVCAGDKLRFWADHAFLFLYHLAAYLRRPWRISSLTYPFGIAAGCFGCLITPPVHTDPPAEREYDFTLKDF